jgi:hypothetical protein
MSLVSTFIKGTDGNFYQNPVYFRDDWFICFDDDDPIELVVKIKANLNPSDIMAQLEGFPAYRIEKHSTCTRFFHHSGNRRLSGEPAIAYWIHLTPEGVFKPFPVPDAFDGDFSELPKGWQGVFYGCTKKDFT